MAKYSFEFKLKVAQEYVAGQGGYGYLAQKYAIKNLEQVHRWVNSYRELSYREALSLFYYLES